MMLELAGVMAPHGGGAARTPRRTGSHGTGVPRRSRVSQSWVSLPADGRTASVGMRHSSSAVASSDIPIHRKNHFTRQTGAPVGDIAKAVARRPRRESD